MAEWGTTSTQSDKAKANRGALEARKAYAEAQRAARRKKTDNAALKKSGLLVSREPKSPPVAEKRAGSPTGRPMPGSIPGCDDDDDDDDDDDEPQVAPALLKSASPSVERAPSFRDQSKERSKPEGTTQHQESSSGGAVAPFPSTLRSGHSFEETLEQTKSFREHSAEIGKVEATLHQERMKKLSRQQSQQKLVEAQALDQSEAQADAAQLKALDARVSALLLQEGFAQRAKRLWRSGRDKEGPLWFVPDSKAPWRSRGGGGENSLGGGGGLKPNAASGSFGDAGVTRSAHGNRGGGGKGDDGGGGGGGLEAEAPSMTLPELTKAKEALQKRIEERRKKREDELQKKRAAAPAAAAATGTIHLKLGLRVSAGASDEFKHLHNCFDHLCFSLSESGDSDDGGDDDDSSDSDNGCDGGAENGTSLLAAPSPPSSPPSSSPSPSSSPMWAAAFKRANASGSGLCSLHELEEFVLRVLVEAHPHPHPCPPPPSPSPGLIRARGERGKGLLGRFQVPLQTARGKGLFNAFKPCCEKAFHDAKDERTAKRKKPAGVAATRTEAATTAERSSSPFSSSSTSIESFVSEQAFPLFCAYLVLHAAMHDAYFQLSSSLVGEKERNTNTGESEGEGNLAPRVFRWQWWQQQLRQQQQGQQQQQTRQPRQLSIIQFTEGHAVLKAAYGFAALESPQSKSGAAEAFARELSFAKGYSNHPPKKGQQQQQQQQPLRGGGGGGRIIGGGRRSSGGGSDGGSLSLGEWVAWLKREEVSARTKVGKVILVGEAKAKALAQRWEDEDERRRRRKKEEEGDAEKVKAAAATATEDSAASARVDEASRVPEQDQSTPTVAEDIVANTTTSAHGEVTTTQDAHASSEPTAGDPTSGDASNTATASSEESVISSEAATFSATPAAAAAAPVAAREVNGGEGREREAMEKVTAPSPPVGVGGARSTAAAGDEATRAEAKEKAARVERGNGSKAGTGGKAAMSKEEKKEFKTLKAKKENGSLKAKDEKKRYQVLKTKARMELSAKTTMVLPDEEDGGTKDGTSV